MEEKEKDLKVNLMFDKAVTEALADIQDPDIYEGLSTGLDELEDFIFGHVGLEKDAAMACLATVHHLKRLLLKLSGQPRKK